MLTPFYIHTSLPLESPPPPYQCFGELLSYGEGDIEDVVSDWQQGKLQHMLLNGRFLLVFWDNEQQTWTLITDRVGAYHAYAVWRNGKVAAIGTDLVQLARTESGRSLDWEALASFFAFGFFLDDRTYYEDIRILQPASIYVISAQGELLKHQRYWEWHHTVDEYRSYPETLEAYHELWTRSVSRCLNGRIMLPISGGLDSRSIAAVISKSKSIESYSYGYTEDSIETSIAGKIAAARGFKFTRHTMQPYLFDRLETIVAALHGSQDVTQARQMSVNDWVAARADAVLTGLWGDVWCDQMGAADGIHEDVAMFVMHKFEKRGRHWLLEHLIAPQKSGLHGTNNLLERVQSGIADFAAIKDVDFRVKAYKTSRWAFRWSNASLRGFQVGAVPRAPYYDVDLIDFFCTVPTAFVRERRLQIDHLKQYAPKLASILWQQSGTNLYQIQYKRWLPLPRYAFNKVKRRLLHRQPIQRNWEVQFLSAEGRKMLEAWLLQPDRVLSQVVSPNALRAFVDEFYRSPDAAKGYTASMLLTFSAWLETSI